MRAPKTVSEAPIADAQGYVALVAEQKQGIADARPPRQKTVQSDLWKDLKVALQRFL